MRRLLSVAPVLLWLITPLAFAQLPGITSQPLPGGGQSWSLPVQTLVFITSLTFIPAILLMMTSFTRIIIVFGLLRNALGTPSAPPNQVLLGLALFLTFFIMSPVIDKIYVDAYQPFSEEKISMQEALEKGAQPLREFMLRQTREADLGLFARLANTGPLQGPEAVPMRILLPAYVTSELKTAFQIGFTIFIPFLIIDLVIASVLMALGMMMVPPATIMFTRLQHMQHFLYPFKAEKRATDHQQWRNRPRDKRTDNQRQWHQNHFIDQRSFRHAPDHGKFPVGPHT